MSMDRYKPVAGAVLVLVMMSLCMPRAQAIVPDPDNAALLYYQAFLSLADRDDDTRTLLSDVALGHVAPNERARKYVQGCRSAIEFAEAAAEVRDCHWGIRYSQGFDALMPHLAQVRFLVFVLLADARIKAADGDYRGALERCLMTDKLARHVGDDTLVSYLVAASARDMGYLCIADLIGPAGSDASLLRWLKDRLATTSDRELTPTKWLQTDMEIVMDLMQMDRIEKFAEFASGGDERMRANIIATTNEESLAQARRQYSQRVAAAMTILGSSLPYEQASARLEQLDQDIDPNDPGSAVSQALMPSLSPFYTLKTRFEARANATRAGIEIYLRKVENGKLPVALPPGLPKDPFTGQDFEYEQTDSGFVLRCRGKKLGADDKVNEYAFTVQ